MGIFPLTLRPAESKDIQALIGLACASQASSMGKLSEFQGREADLKAAFTRFITDDLEDITIAERDGACLGFCATEGPTDEISDVWVHPSHQGRGVGAILLATAETQVKMNGFSCSWLTTHAQNSRALNFYRTHGYALLSITKAQSVSLPDVTYPKATLGKQLHRPNAAAAETMADVRIGIDTLDPMLVSLVAERFAFIDRAADLKPALAMPARVGERVEEVVANARAQAEGMGFDPDLTETLWRTMIDLAIEREEDKMASPQPEPAA